MSPNSEWLDGFHAWRAGKTGTAEYRSEEEARSRIRQAQEAGFEGRELMRLDVYRRAVAAGFFNDAAA